MSATIAARQSSRVEANRPGMLKSPLPSDSGDWVSPPIARAMAGSARLLVIETRNPQMASPNTTAITNRPIHTLESAGDDSKVDAFRIRSTAGLHPRL